MIFERFKKFFFVGIGGIGMSGIAEIMHNLNFDISGSDQNENSNTIRLKMGVKINIGHGKKGIKGSDLVVFSSAIKKNNKRNNRRLEKIIFQLFQEQKCLQRF